MLIAAGLLAVVAYSWFVALLVYEHTETRGSLAAALTALTDRQDGVPWIFRAPLWVLKRLVT